MTPLVSWLAALVCASGEGRLAWAEVELRGPLEEVTLDCGRDGLTRIRMNLRSGEELALRVPLPLSTSAVDEGQPASSRASLRVRGSGRASLGRIAADPAESRFERLPLGLRSRPRPPVAAGRARGGLAELLLVGTAFVLARSRHQALVAASAAIAGAAVFLLATRHVPEAPPGRVVEIEAGTPEWIEIDGALGALALPLERLEVEPAHAALELDLELRAGELVGEVRSPGARLHGLRVGVGEIPTRERNEAGDFERSYTRDGAGGWLEHGPWKYGEPLPPSGLPDGGLRSQPPGWLLAGSPPGRTIFLGLRRDGAWVRALGF